MRSAFGTYDAIVEPLVAHVAEVMSFSVEPGSVESCAVMRGSASRHQRPLVEVDARFFPEVVEYLLVVALVESPYMHPALVVSLGVNKLRPLVSELSVPQHDRQRGGDRGGRSTDTHRGVMHVLLNQIGDDDRPWNELRVVLNQVTQRLTRRDGLGDDVQILLLTAW